jgi:hypothetical protein
MCGVALVCETLRNRKELITEAVALLMQNERLGRLAAERDRLDLIDEYTLRSERRGARPGVP